MADEFEKYLVKEYQYWAVYVHLNQGYLGRCVIWCRREEAEDLTDAKPEEQRELFQVLNELRETQKRVFQPDWFNYAFLGNETRHLHGHFIPRYAKPREFAGLVFEDKLYGHNYKTDRDFHTPPEVLEQIRDHLKSALN